jgi:BirA family biotin operon repressor/biotin-[acetyl-CoA-carboxylase] ligase
MFHCGAIVFAFGCALPHNLAIPRASTTRRAAQELSARTDGRLGRIVRLLTDHATVVVSGTKIGAEIGVSRSAVWRFIQQLRALGVEVAGHPTTGYQLKKVPDLLLPEILAPLVKGTMFAKHLHHYFRVGSTNEAALQAAAAGEPAGSAFLAEEQTAGRGRGGHGWHSEKSAGIYCSVLLRPAMSPAEVLMLSLASGLAVEAAVEQVTGLRGDLRWPNDVLLQGKKFCGILAEMNAEATRVRHVVVGIGINVNHDSFPAELRSTSTSLRLEAGHPWSRVELVAALLKSLDREYRALEGVEATAAREAVLHRFEERSSYARGKPVHVAEDGGYEGITDGLDPRGFLRVRTEKDWRTVLSGTVRALES